MPLGFWLGWSRVTKGAKGLNIFPRAKDPDPLFFCPRAVSWPTKHSPPSQHRAFCFARLEHGPNVFVLSPFVPTFSYHPPILLSSCAPSSSLYYSFIPAHHLYLVSTSRATFSLFDNGKNLGGRGRERRKKAHARCCQSRRVFFRLSQTPNARLGFRLTDNRRGEDSLIGGETPLGPRFITFLARCQTILSVPFSVYTPLFLPPWFILNSLMTRSRMMYDGVASRVE